ncbi:MAG: N-acetylneuraminate synthase family protein [Acidimicrobiaceae bacterium]|nr:N-acetylneuraminate synthase family protein [Acidimicrobiaceae bacterium]
MNSKTAQIKIGKRMIGVEYPPFVIAEVGINHEGDVKKALQMVDAAVAAGSEVIKFQCHITEQEMIPTDMTPGEISTEKLWDIIKRCELTESEEIQVMRYCESKGIMYLSTPFSREAADRLNEMNIPAFKIGSGECNNFPLIAHIAAMGRPMIVSTGMNDLNSVMKTVDLIKSAGTSLALLHCTSMYPTPYESVRLGAVSQLREKFPDVPIGLSDHSANIWTCLGAVALGACILEKHFTVSRTWPGPDVPISIEPQELNDLIIGSRAIWSARGGEKTILPGEQPVIDFAYATVVTIKDVASGENFTRDNLWVKRPGLGPIPANDLESILGRRAKRAVAKDQHLVADDIDKTR